MISSYCRENGIPQLGNMVFWLGQQNLNEVLFQPLSWFDFSQPVVVKDWVLKYTDKSTSKTQSVLKLNSFLSLQLSGAAGDPAKPAEHQEASAHQGLWTKG